MSNRWHMFLLLGAVSVGLLARVPGIFWGYNFPLGFNNHHVDEWTHIVNAEILMDPITPPRWVHAYPKGLAAHVAVPLLMARLFQGELHAPLPDVATIVLVGRAVTVLYGAGTILIVYLFARRFFQDIRVALIAAWIMALGGLHVTQSHFFVADVPGLFWFLSGLYLLLVEFAAKAKMRIHFLAAASLCFGIAFGIKLVIAGPVVLAIAVLLRPSRIIRAMYAGVFFFTGVIAVNLAFFTPLDVYRTIVHGINDPYVFNRFLGLVLYGIELPSIVSLPVVVLAIAGTALLTKRFLTGGIQRSQHIPLALYVLFPVALNLLLVFVSLDHFPRHLIPFVPWISLVAAWSLIQFIDRLGARRIASTAILASFFCYLILFVYDGERAFFSDPRNRAALWLEQHGMADLPIYWRSPGMDGWYNYVHFPDDGRPPVLVMQMDWANHYLSGIGWRDSYPRDYRNIFASVSQARVDALQAVFQGKTEYREAARFDEGYFMPEYTIADQLIGNRSRNYVAEIVIFVKEGFADGSTKDLSGSEG